MTIPWQSHYLHSRSITVSLDVQHLRDVRVDEEVLVRCTCEKWRVAASAAPRDTVAKIIDVSMRRSRDASSAAHPNRTAPPRRQEVVDRLRNTPRVSTYFFLSF